MDFLDFIPANVFETVGFIAGFTACIVIAVQVYKEYKSTLNSSLSMSYVIGWAFIFFFWALYGIRFDAKAIIVSNIVAFTIQMTLLFVILNKKRNLKNKGL